MAPEVLSQVAASVVRISLSDSGEESGNGTGFVVRADGVVVTNHHVVDERESTYVAVFKDGTKRKVLGSLSLDKEHDLALLRIEPGHYSPLTLAPSAEIAVAQPVFLIGSSSGLDQSLGVGVIAALRPEGFPEDWKKRYEESGYSVVAGPIVQHTASSSPGSSGAPVVDLQGRVVAVHHSQIVGAPIYFGAHVDALRTLLAKTDLDAPPEPFGPRVGRNLLISVAVLAGIALLIAGPGLIDQWWQRRRSRRGWSKGR